MIVSASIQQKMRQIIQVKIKQGKDATASIAMDVK